MSKLISIFKDSQYMFTIIFLEGKKKYQKEVDKIKHSGWARWDEIFKMG